MRSRENPPALSFWDSGFGAPGLGLRVGRVFFVRSRVEDSGFRASGLRVLGTGFTCRVLDLGCRIHGSGLGLWFSSWFMVKGLRVGS